MRDRTVIKLGLLDPPERVPYGRNTSDEEPWQSAAHKAMALQVAHESVEDEPVRLMVGASSADVRLETTVTVSR